VYPQGHRRGVILAALSGPFLVERTGILRRPLTYMPFFSVGYILVRHSSPLLHQRISRLTGLLAISVFLASRACSQDAAPAAASDLFSSVITNQKKSELLLDEYERIQRVEKRKTASDPNPTETKVLRLFPVGTGVDKLVLSTDGKLTAPDTHRIDLENLQKYLLWILQDGTPQKEAYAKAERRRKERFDLIEATHQAFVFTLEGKEQRGNRTLLRYSMVPNPKYRPTSRNTVLFTKVRGTIWVDEESSELAKVDGSVTEDFSIALFLAKVYKGSHFMQERYEVAPGVWEPTFEQYDFDGRKYMLPFSIHERSFYSDYKRDGPPKEAVEIVRAELNKLSTDRPSR
jgi:hypothetical protein